MLWKFCENFGVNNVFWAITITIHVKFNTKFPQYIIYY